MASLTNSKKNHDWLLGNVGIIPTLYRFFFWRRPLGQHTQLAKQTNRGHSLCHKVYPRTQTLALQVQGANMRTSFLNRIQFATYSSECIAVLPPFMMVLLYRFDRIEIYDCNFIQVWSYWRFMIFLYMFDRILYRFDRIDKEFKGLMTEAKKEKNVIRATGVKARHKCSSYSPFTIHHQN